MPSPRRRPLPDFVIAGAPKAGSSALHAALARHPQLFLSVVKEPKYFLCADAPPPLYTGPGDAHSRREWVWRLSDYEALFADAPDTAVRGESTPFYLMDQNSHRRMRDLIPQARIIAVLRDPVDRAYSNWMHLWVDGLEPEWDIIKACEAEEARIAGGWAPFWRYRGLGRYGEQLESLYASYPREQVMVIRYRELVDEPVRILDEVCRFLGVATGILGSVPRDNTRPFVSNGPRRAVLSRVVRAGAGAGAFFSPQLWRRASRPVLRAMHLGHSADRPELTAEQRRLILEPILPDLERLESVTGQSFADWKYGSGKGSFASRARQAV
ncbi:MAG: hypothetical protein QOI06_509 [Nocardioidaceae bacterium]|jgi:hypothetical protein|nr:hypothetical protein [Nocardioidaceae bacterium]